MEWRILVADDDSSNRRLLELVLHSAEFCVELASDGREALQKALERPFDLIISDQTMPGLTGERLAAELHRIQPGTPLILLSGHLFDEKSPIPEGVCARFLKPLAPTALLAAVEEILSRE